MPLPNGERSKKKEVTFKEYDVLKLVKAGKWTIVTMEEDETVFNCLVQNEDGYLRIVFWKNHSMVVLEDDYERVFIGNASSK